MSRIDSCFFGQGEEVRTDTFFQLIEVTALQVGTSDAAIEEHITCKDAGSFLAMKDKATGRVSWHMIGFQTGIAKGDDIAFANVLAQGRLLLIVLESEATRHGISLLQPKLILLTTFWT